MIRPYLMYGSGCVVRPYSSAYVGCIIVCTCVHSTVEYAISCLVSGWEYFHFITRVRGIPLSDFYCICHGQNVHILAVRQSD